MTDLKIGMVVEVTHINGKEIGFVESFDYKTGKVLVAFGVNSGLNFCLFNITQVKAVA